MNLLQSLILPPLSAIYSAVTRTRLAAYRRGWLSISQLAAPVISVGNLTTGGTGKTPLVEWVCRVLASTAASNTADSNASRVCVLTRGYGKANPQSQVVVSNGKKLLAAPRESGDEPYLLAKNLIGRAAVIANPDRTAAGTWTIKNLGTEVCVLDDGFQHLALSRDLDIVTVDATNPWGGGSLLPYGRLREPLAGLSRASCVVITRTEQVQDVTPIKNELQRLVPGVPVFSSRMVTSGIHTLTGQAVDSSSLPSHKVAAFCGVGNPESFFNHLRREGYSPSLTRAFSDHHAYTQADIDRLVNDARHDGETVLLTTAKDALKLTELDIGLACYVLDIQIVIDDADQLVEMILNAASQKRLA
jgi:tetraacyldisaccharide 4'-kinase